jgi:transmembrane sensor
MAPMDFSKAQRIIYLISRYIEGGIDFGELQELGNWRKEKPGNEVLFQELTDKAEQDIAVEELMAYDTEGSLQKIKQIMRQEAHARKTTYGLWWRVLAAASVIIVIGTIFFLYNKRESVNNNASLTPHPIYIAAGTNKAILTLANGKKIAIDNKGSGVVATQGNTRIRKTANGKIVYQVAGAEKDIAATGYNTIETPMGGQYKVQLPDGTNVWLNAASSLRYPTTFTGKQRLVTLTGEAYFEVVHNKTHPFIVKTATQDVTDIGTHFNINSYTDEPHTATTLLEGAVSVSADGKQQTLSPGQQSINTSGSLKISQADINIATAWKDGQLAFHHTDIQNVLRQISRWYNISIEYRGVAPDITISGGISRQEDLSAILKILQLSEVHFIQQGRKLIIIR